jgi:hypothetical protein
MRMGIWSVVGLCLGIAACKPLYGGPPEHIHTAGDVKPHPADPPPPPTIYHEECQASFQDDPHKWNPKPKAAVPLIETGDTALASSDKAKEETAKVGLIRDAIDKYRLALQKDPYSADATLKLAVAYDKVLYKGCALAMLKRLASLAANPKFATDTSHALGAIGDNGTWFKGYRKDAMQAAGL